MKKLIPLLGFVLFLLPGSAEAVCGGSSPNLTAASSSRTDVNDCVTAAVTGDTITVPAGTSTWATPITLPSGTDLILDGNSSVTCSGTPGTSGYTCSSDASTDITCTQTCLNISLTATQEVTGFDFTHSGTSQLIGFVGVQNAGERFSVHNNRLNSSGNWTAIEPKNNSDTSGSGLHPQGIFYENHISNISIKVYATTCNLSETCGEIENHIWNSATSLGDSVEVVYIEDNYFDSGSFNINFTDSSRAGRMVVRFNTTHSRGYFEIHSVQGAENRGVQRWEIHNNALVDQDDTAACFFGMGLIRSGTGVFFDNTMYGDYAGCELSARFDNVRSSGTFADPPGECDGGSTGWDENSGGGQGYACRDQIGIGQDNTLWDDSAPGAWDQIKSPAYWYNNRRDSTQVDPTVSTAGLNTTHIQEDRDYYDFDASFDGTSGVGSGTLASRPGTCTTGVAYWVTDQQEWDSDSAGVDGRLDKCTATNTWTAGWYVPEDHPHPWQSAPALPPPNAPSNLIATVISTSQIDLSWTDNSDDEDNFELERCTGVGCSSFANINDPAANATSYENTGLTQSTSYSYRIRATNTNGDSDYSNTATGVTLDPPPTSVIPGRLRIADGSGTLVFDYESPDLVDNFEARYDGGAYVDIGKTPALTAGAFAFVLPGLLAGIYTLSIRACNQGGCSEDSGTLELEVLPDPPPPVDAATIRVQE